MKKFLSALSLLTVPFLASASEADLVIPDSMGKETILYWGFLIVFGGFLFGLYQFTKVKKLRAHPGMDYYRYSRIVQCCLVWYQDEYTGKLANGFCFAGKETHQTA